MKLKKIISAAVGATMLCASLPFSSTMVDFVKDNTITANAEDEMPSYGKCGENVYYSLSDDGVLTISGTGKMYDYDHETANPSPLSGSLVKSVVIENGVTSIGDLAFFGCENLTEVVIADSVTSIGEGAFFIQNGLKINKKKIPWLFSIIYSLMEQVVMEI